MVAEYTYHIGFCWSIPSHNPGSCYSWQAIVNSPGFGSHSLIPVVRGFGWCILFLGKDKISAVVADAVMNSADCSLAADLRHRRWHQYLQPDLGSSPTERVNFQQIQLKTHKQNLILVINYS